MTNAYERAADVFITARKDLADLPINRPVAKPAPAPRPYPFLERMKKKMEEEEEEARSIRLRQEYERRGLPASSGLPVGASLKDINDALERTLLARGPEEIIKARQAEARAGLPRVLTRTDVLLTEQNVQNLPRPLQPFGQAVREMTSPAALAMLAATAGIGPGAAAGIRGGTGLAGAARGLAAGALEPVVRGGFGARFGAEAAMSLGAMAAAEEARRRTENAPGPVRIAAPLVAGLGGGLGTLGGIRAAGKAAPALRQAGRNIAKAPMGPSAAPKVPAKGDVLEGLAGSLKGKPLTVVDASDSAMLTVRNEEGTTLKIGRNAVKWREGAEPLAAGQKPLAEAAPAAKEPWQMTRVELLGTDATGNTLRDKALANSRLRKAIQQALSEGKPVPPEVLRDYPDLAAKPQAPAAEALTRGVSTEPATTSLARREQGLVGGLKRGEPLGLADLQRLAQSNPDEVVLLKGTAFQGRHFVTASQALEMVKAKASQVSDVWIPKEVVTDAQMADRAYAEAGQGGGAYLSPLERDALLRKLQPWEIFNPANGQVVKSYGGTDRVWATFEVPGGKGLEGGTQYLVQGQSSGFVPGDAGRFRIHGTTITEKDIIQSVQRPTEPGTVGLTVDEAYRQAKVSAARGQLAQVRQARQARQSITEPAGVAKPLSPSAQTPVQAPVPAPRAATPPQPAAPPQAATGGGAAQPPPGGGGPPGGEVTGPIGPTVPPAANEIQSTLSQATAIVQRDRPGVITRIVGYLPGAKQVQHGLHPSLVMPESMTTGWVGKGLAEAKVSTSLQQERIGQLARLEELFGKEATRIQDFKPVNVQFLGTAEQARYPYVGTLADIMARPSLYQLSDEQRTLLATIQNQRSATFQDTRNAYGLDIGEFPVQPGGVHLPNVDVSEDAIEMSGSVRSALVRGRAKERVWPTAADRWAHDNTFRPETTVSKLLAANDQSISEMAGQRVFMEGIGGKTRLEVMQETHPELYTKMMSLRQRLGSLKGMMARLDAKQATAIDDFLASNAEDVDVTALQAALDPTITRGKNLGKNAVVIRREIETTKSAIADLQPAWRVANLKPYVFVQDGVFRYFPATEAKQVRDLLKRSNSPVLRFVDELRATAFGGDLSPITIQGSAAWLSDPIGVSRFFLEGKGGLTEAAMLRDMASDPEGWRLFIGATGIKPLGGVEQEFATGFLARIPKVGKGWEAWNEVLYRPITKMQKDIFTSSYEGGLRAGLTPEQAAAIAADDATKIIPRYNYARLGLSEAKAAQYRAVLTSVSFLTQPAALMTDATKGLVKLATLRDLTRSEMFAVKRVITLVATAEAIAVMSNVYHAKIHNLDIEQAVKDSLNPKSGKFMSLVLPNGARIGLGGPFRSLIKAVVPAQVAGVPIPLPFAGLERFAKSKLGPAVRIAYDEIRNVDYYGKKIRTGEFPVNILQGLEYAFEGSAPLTIGSAAQQARKGATAGTIGQEAASQFMGTNYIPQDLVYEAKVRWQGDFKEYRALPTNVREANAKGLPTREFYRRTHPDVDAKLFITGQVDSLETNWALSSAIALMKEAGIGVEDIKSLEKKPYESVDRTRLRQYFEVWLRPSEKPQTNTQKWEAVSRQMSGTTLQALLNLWSPQRRPLPLAEEQRLRAIFTQYPLGQTNFDTWLKQTLRQLQENAAVESSKQSSPTSGIQLAPLRGTLQPVGGR